MEDQEAEQLEEQLYLEDHDIRRKVRIGLSEERHGLASFVMEHCLKSGRKDSIFRQSSAQFFNEVVSELPGPDARASTTREAAFQGGAPRPETKRDAGEEEVGGTSVARSSCSGAPLAWPS